MTAQTFARLQASGSVLEVRGATLRLTLDILMRTLAGRLCTNHSFGLAPFVTLRPAHPIDMRDHPRR